MKRFRATHGTRLTSINRRNPTLVLVFAETGNLGNKMQLKNFWSKVNKTESCWIWLGGTKRGYGKILTGKKQSRAHRVSFEIHKGPILEGLVIDHICRNKLCVNPDHLRQVTIAQNTIENSNSTGALNKYKTHCVRGHEFNQKNTYLIRRKNGISRMCRKCNALSWLRRKARNKLK